jgi:hypothetical protein
MMKEAENMAFEDRVLAYLDGALDDASSERLLAEIEADSAKQQIFSAHQELDKLIMTARVPLETPEETRRSIAAAIPGLVTYLPHFISSGTAVSLLATRGRTILEFFTQTPLRTALSIGGAAAIITTGAIVTKNLTSGNASDHIPSLTRYERMIASPNATQPNAASTPSGVQGSASSSIQFAPLASSNLASNTRMHGAGSMADRSANCVSVASSATSSATSSAASSATSIVVSDRNNESDRVTVNGSVAGAATSTAASANENDIGSIANPISPRSVTRTVSQPVSEGATPYPIFVTPRSYREPLGVNVTAGFAARYLMLPSVDGENENQLGTSAIAAVRVPVTTGINLLAEGGYSSFARARQTASVVPGFGSLEHVVIDTKLATDEAYWTRIGAEYLFGADEETLTPFVSIAGGVAFARTLAPMAAVGTGVKWYWTDYVKFVANVGYEQTWLARENASYSVPASAIVDTHDLNAASVSNSAFTISLGLSTTF